MATLFGMFPFLQKLFADGGYQGPEFSTALAKVRPHLNVEIVKRSDRAKGFVVLSKRWIVTLYNVARSRSFWSVILVPMDHLVMGPGI